MKKQNFCIALSFLGAFVLWTIGVCRVDVQPIGPLGTTVGFATVNQFVHRLIGVRMSLYTLTDWLGLIPLGLMLGFALLGLAQWIQRKRLCRVDRSILVLGGFYAVLMGAYMFFERLTVNYRPILIHGHPEISYPSSTTLLVLCVIPTAVMQLNSRIKNPALKRGIALALTAFAVFMVIGRLLSGVHWFTDIVGGALLSAGLVMMYRSLL